MSLVATTRKLGISFLEYIRDRISKKSKISSLASIIRQKSFIDPQTVLQQEELLLNTG